MATKKKTTPKRGLGETPSSNGVFVVALLAIAGFLGYKLLAKPTTTTATTSTTVAPATTAITSTTVAPAPVILWPLMYGDNGDHIGIMQERLARILGYILSKSGTIYDERGNVIRVVTSVWDDFTESMLELAGYAPIKYRYGAQSQFASQGSGVDEYAMQSVKTVVPYNEKGTQLSKVDYDNIINGIKKTSSFNNPVGIFHNA